MRVNVYLRNMTSMTGVSPHVLAAAEGFRHHGIEPALLTPGNPQPCDLAVCWGVKKKAEMASGRRALILERGYIGDRLGVWTSAGYDGLNGHADFCNRDSPADRWERLYGDDTLQPWRGHGGNYVLILGQMWGDASLGAVDIPRWYADTALRLINAGLTVGFRPHPNWPYVGPPPGVTPITGTLDEALAQAKWVVTWNSNSAVDAVVRGIPAVTCNRGSMAWDVTGHDPVQPPSMPDRRAWSHRMAYTQWTMEEMAAGDMWAHLQQGMVEDVARPVVALAEHRPGSRELMASDARP